MNYRCVLYQTETKYDEWKIYKRKLNCVTFKSFNKQIFQTK